MQKKYYLIEIVSSGIGGLLISFIWNVNHWQFYVAALIWCLIITIIDHLIQKHHE